MSTPNTESALTPPMRIRLFAWWAGCVQGAGIGAIVCAGIYVRSVWPFVVGLLLILVGWLLDERVGDYARAHIDGSEVQS